MKKIEFTSKTAFIKSEKLLNLLSEDNNVSLEKGGDLIVLYQMYDDDDNLKNHDLEIKTKTSFSYYYSFEFSGSYFGSVGVKYGKLCDIIGFSNPTSYWME